MIAKKLKLLYIIDPHCGWCFGFGQIILELFERYKNNKEVEFDVITGGLFVPKIQTSKSFADDKRPIAQRVSQLAGVNFSEAYFTDVIGKNGYLDSEIPCKIINTVKLLNNNLIPFMEDLLRLEYIEGKNISNYNNAASIISKYDFDERLFKEKHLSEEVHQNTLQDFQFSKQLAAGFPVLIVNTENEFVQLARGFASSDKLIKKIDVIIRI